MSQQVYSVDGMTCSNCVRHVTLAFEDIPGVQEAKVDLEKAKATVTWEDEPVAIDEVKAALEEAGYTVALRPDDTPW